MSENGIPTDWRIPLSTENIYFVIHNGNKEIVFEGSHRLGKRQRNRGESIKS